MPRCHRRSSPGHVRRLACQHRHCRAVHREYTERLWHRLQQAVKQADDSRPYDSPVSVATFLAHSLPLVLLAALSPVLFLNASRFVEAAGILAGLCFAGGAVLCLVAFGIPTMGLMGAATSQLVATGLASRGVDLILALLLIGYGTWQLVRSRRHRTASGSSRGNKDDALPVGGRALFAAGLLGMLTNFTTLPLYLSVAQRIGTVAAPWWTRALLLAMVIVIVAASAWLPVTLRAVAPKHSRLTPETDAGSRPPPSGSPSAPASWA